MRPLPSPKGHAPQVLEEYVYPFGVSSSESKNCVTMGIAPQNALKPPLAEQL